MARLLMWRQKRTDDPLANDALKRKVGPFASSSHPPIVEQLPVVPRLSVRFQPKTDSWLLSSEMVTGPR